MTTRRGGLAQLVERLLCMQKVTGSIPVTSISRFARSAFALIHFATTHHPTKDLILPWKSEYRTQTKNVS